MNVEINGKSLELSFGFKFLREIDNRLGLKVEQASIGQGVSMLPVGLEKWKSGCDWRSFNRSYISLEKNKQLLLITLMKH